MTCSPLAQADESGKDSVQSYTVNASFDYRYLILMALTFVLGWEAHALWVSLGPDDEKTEETATETQDDTGVFSEDGQSMLSEEETEVILSYQIKPGDTFFFGAGALRGFAFQSKPAVNVQRIFGHF